MEKQQVIEFIKNQMALGAISSEDLRVLAGREGVEGALTVQAIDHTETVGGKLARVFYGIGAVVVLIGIVILLAQYWNDIGLFGRLVVTLGVALSTYVAGLLMRVPEQKALSQVMFVIASVLAPFGTFILLDKTGLNSDWLYTVFTPLALLAVFAVAWVVNRRPILVLINVAFATWAYYGFLVEVLPNISLYGPSWIKWATILLGLAYVLFAYGYSQGELDDSAGDKRAVAGMLYGLGALAFLGGGIALGGVWDIIFIAFLFGSFYASVFLRSRSMLIFSAFFLMGHIMKLTGKYFIGSIGWPVALVMAGFVIIGVGYFTFYLNKKYLSIK